MSDVFNEYAKIMASKGFVKKAQQTSVEKENDSDYAEKIKALYGLDIKLNDSNKDIIEQAHPEKVIVAPSYDRVNGLVENINERHDIMTGICNKPTNGNLTQHRYAEKELLDELVRIGFQLDNEGNEHLSKLADQCAFDLSIEVNEKIASLNHNGIEKKAWILPALRVAGPWIVKGLLAATTLATIKTQVIGNISQGIVPDADAAFVALNDLKNSVSSRYVGKIEQWMQIVSFIKDNAKKAELISGNTEMQVINSPEDVSSSLEVKKRVQASQEDIKFLNEFKKMSSFVAGKIGSGGVMSGSGLIGEIDAMQSDSGETQSQWWQGLKGMWGSTFGDHKTAAKNALAALRNSLVKFIDEFNSSTNQAASEIQQQTGILEQAKTMIGVNHSETNDLNKYVRP